MAELIRYEAARTALSEALRVDEVMDIRDRMIALEAYSRQAKDSQLLDNATDIRLRAERRAGELLVTMKRNGDRQGAGRPEENARTESTITAPKKLSDLGVSKDQSSRWQAIAKLPEAQFEKRVAQAKRNAINSVEMTPAEKAAIKKVKREEREQELATKLLALPVQKFGVIYADPEWDFQPYSRETGMDRSAANHYPTSPLEAIAARDVDSISAGDSVLFLWTPRNQLHNALYVMGRWGFAYKTCFGWGKDRLGTGYWNRDNLELLLIGTRGDIPAPAPGTQFPALMEAEVGAHSEKPEIFTEMIETYYPTIPKIELNRRGPPREGWAAWGDEVTVEASNEHR